MLYIAAFAWLFVGGFGLLLLSISLEKRDKPWIKKATMLTAAVSISLLMGVFFFLLASASKGDLEISRLWNCIWKAFIILGMPCIISFVFRLCGFFTVRKGENIDETRRYAYAAFIYYLGLFISAWLAIYLGKVGSCIIGFGISLLIAAVVYLSARNRERQ